MKWPWVAFKIWFPFTNKTTTSLFCVSGRLHTHMSMGALSERNLFKENLNVFTVRNIPNYFCVYIILYGRFFQLSWIMLKIRTLPLAFWRPLRERLPLEFLRSPNEQCSAVTSAVSTPLYFGSHQFPLPELLGNINYHHRLWESPTRGHFTVACEIIAT